MEQLPEKTKQSLPKIADLYANVELAAKQNDLNRLLNCEPKREWLKEHHQAKRKVKTESGDTVEVPALYIPIEVVEYLLTSIFIKWRVEVKSTKLVANSIVVEVRLHVQDPVTGEWDWQDGIGASPVHTAKGAGATEFDKINTYSVMTAAPAAESYAVKDAAEKFGKLFGKDINRKDEINYAPMMEAKFTPQVKVEIPEQLKTVIAETKDTNKLTEIYTVNKAYHSNPEFMKLLNQRKQQLNGTVHA